MRFWRWVLSLFRPKPKALPVSVGGDLPDHLAILGVEQMKPYIPSPNAAPFDRLFVEAAEEALQAQRKEEEETFSDELLRKYLAAAIEEMVRDTGDGSEIIISSNSFGYKKPYCQVPRPLFETFFRILQGVCEPYGIEMRLATSTGIFVNRESVKAALENLKVQQHIDIDERIRAMTHMGPYR
jgi:hypothetical protein